MMSTAPARRCRTRVRPAFLRHPMRQLLPAALQEFIDDNVLEALFRDALVAEFLFPSLAEVRRLPGELGQTVTMNRTGLMTPDESPVTGSDAPTGSYNKEQFRATYEQYGRSIDTNLLGSAGAVASTYARDVRTLGTHAGQSLNRIARAALFGRYIGGRTWVRTAAGGSDVTVEVQSVAGFGEVLVNGVPTPVSAANPLNITVNGVANTVVGVNPTTRVLTLGTAMADTIDHVIVATNAPASLRAGARTSARTIVGGDVATVGIYMDAVARLRESSVPPAADGMYLADVTPRTIRQLLSDAEFRQAFQSLGLQAAEVRAGTVIEYGGCMFRVNNECPVVATGSDGTTVPVHRTIVSGAEPLVAIQLAEQADLLAELGAQSNAVEVEVISPAEGGLQVVLLGRAPQDRFQQIVATTWSWVGGFAVPTDSVSGDAAIAKRCVVVEHAG